MPEIPRGQVFSDPDVSKAIRGCALRPDPALDDDDDDDDDAPPPPPAAAASAASAVVVVVVQVDFEWMLEKLTKQK